DRLGLLGERHLVGRHELGRAGHAGEGDTPVASAAEVMVRSILVVYPRLDVPKPQRRHCFSSSMARSQGLMAESCASMSPTTTMISPCALILTAVTISPASFAARTARATSFLRKV